jgi:hypothetical protein
LVLGLTFSVRKHRFGADLRTNFLEELDGPDKFHSVSKRIRVFESQKAKKEVQRWLANYKEF